MLVTVVTVWSSSTYEASETLKYGGLRLCPDKSLNLAAIFENEHRRYALDTESGSCSLIGIDIELANEHLSPHLRRELVDDRRDHTAWSAPCRPEIDENRYRGRLNLRGEVGVGHHYRPGRRDKR